MSCLNKIFYISLKLLYIYNTNHKNFEFILSWIPE